MINRRARIIFSVRSLDCGLGGLVVDCPSLVFNKNSKGASVIHLDGLLGSKE